MVATSEPTLEKAKALRCTSWPAADLENVCSCPACGNQSRTLLHDDVWDASFLAAAGRWQFQRCDNCKSAYLDPRPTPASLNRAYSGYYTHTQTADRADPSALRGWLKRALANGYRNWRFGGHRRPATFLGALIGKVAPSIRHHIDYAFRYLPKAQTSSHLLDVGCGGGLWLKEAAISGWQVHGVDFDPVAVQRARADGLDVREGAIEAWSDAPGYFDAITMSHVIEHVTDPSRLLEEAFDLLRPGGTLYVDTPNIDAPTHIQFGRMWRGLEAPRHLIILNFKTLKDLLIKAGFEDIRQYATPGVANFLIAASNHMRSLDRNSPSEPCQIPTPAFTASEPEFLTVTCRRPFLAVSPR